MALPLGGDIPPNPTIYVNNLYEKLRKEGEPPLAPHPNPSPTLTQGRTRAASVTSTGFLCESF